jgi:hypothetical protein
VGNLKESIVNKTLALLCGAALAAAATVTLAQTTPPGTDRPSGESSGQSAKPDPDKKGGATKGATGTPKAGGTPTPPGTDRPGGETSTQSAKPKPDKK